MQLNVFFALKEALLVFSSSTLQYKTFLLFCSLSTYFNCVTVTILKSYRNLSILTLTS